MQSSEIFASCPILHLLPSLLSSERTPPEFAVSLDAVLRGNIYCGHITLSRRLKLPSKVLRKTLVGLVEAGLMKMERLEQVRIDRINRKRSFQSEFWYVPLRDVLESFIYRVHRKTKELDEIIMSARESQEYMCERCPTV